nr:hypothetical protein BaRGS_013797 [Batillaria attramentaria]
MLVPTLIQLDKEELKRLIEEAKDQIDDDSDAEEAVDENNDADTTDSTDGATAAKAKAKKEGKKRKLQDDGDEDDDLVQKYGLDDYDDEEDVGNPLSGIGGLAEFVSYEDDPYITLKNDDSDNEDDQIKKTDNLIICGRHQEDSCILEVHVYNEELANLYVHHDYLLSSFPLVVEWLDYDVADGSTGNFVAVGTMEPVIEIWDLDVMESMEAVTTLGSKPQKKKKKAKKKESVVGHTDAVLDLSWNKNVRNVLASASADFTVGLWDLSEGKPVTTLRQHTEKVQCVKWHPKEAQTLLSGSFDHTAKVFDCRSPDDSHRSWTLEGEVERVAWNIHNPIQFLASTDKGMLYCVDIRNDKPVFNLSAHNKAITGVSFSSQIPGLLVTTSEDKTMKVWDVEGDKPSQILSRNLRMNELQCVGCCPEAPFVFAFGGESELKVWDVRESAAVRKHFLKRMPVKLADECKGDEGDLMDAAEDAMERLNMEEDDEDVQPVPPQPAKKKKKKKKKMKPKKTDLDL